MKLIVYDCEVFAYDGKADPICYDFVDDIGYLVKSYKKRCSTYRKNNCYFIGD